MEIPEVDDEYRNEIEKARRDLRALIYSKTCAPIMLRLAFNDAATYCKATHTGGPNGSIRKEEEFTQSCNKGLKVAIDFCEEIKSKHPMISYADIYQLAGVVAVEMTGGPTIDFTPGRVDSEECTEEGRLPDPREGANNLRDKFFFLGLYDKDVVALSGAHTLGKTHEDISGFDGPWTSNPLVFDNSYFKELIKGQSEGLVQLPSDRALVDDPMYRKFVEKYAEDQELFFQHYAIAHKKLADIMIPKFTSYIPLMEMKTKEKKKKKSCCLHKVLLG